MEAVNKLVKKNLSLNKQRTIVSIIGIILSCSLITALFGLVVSFQESLIDASLKSFGNRHVTFEKVEKENIEEIKNHKNVKSYFLSNTKVSRNGRDLTGVVGLDTIAMNNLKNHIVEGNIPTKENEIVLGISYADYNDIKVGDEISVTTGDRYSDGYLLNENNPYIEGEVFKNTITKKYKVVGLCSPYTFLSSEYAHNMYILDNKVANKSNVHVLYNDPKNYEKITMEINESKFISEDGKYAISYNNEYLKWSGYSISDSNMNVFIALAGIISGIIIIVSVFCIRNSFAISVAEKTKIYGMLSSTGATPKQIKKSVLKEGFYLGIIGIPIGIICGIFASYILVIITKILLANNIGANFEFIYMISIEAIIISIILSVITIYLSAIGSARRASKITEIEAIRNQKDIKLNSKKLKTPKIIKMIFKTGGDLAYKNMKRNKSKYRTTIIALVVSITSFISISYFIEIGLKEAGNILKDLSFNFSINAVSDSPLEFETIGKIYDDISKLDNIDEFCILKSKNVKINKEFVNESFNTLGYSGYIFSINKEEYNKFLTKAGLKYEDVKNKGIVVSNKYEKLNENKKIELKNIIDEDLTKITYTNFKEENKTNMDIIFSDEKFMGLENFEGQEVLCILVSEEYFSKIDSKAYYEQIYIKSNNSREFNKSINEYKENLDYDLYVTDITTLANQQNAIVLLVSIFFYGFIAVITLIGLTNIFNTITTNMMLRRREFAILKSTGMTNKEFINMIRLESLFYGIKSLFYGLLFGIGLSYLMFYFINQSTMVLLTNEFTPPYVAIIISVIFVFLVINLIMRYSLSKINKQNIIETIRNENV